MAGCRLTHRSPTICLVILVFGTVCLDRVMRIAGLPKNGGYVEIESEISLLGGEAANTANALTAWGDRPVLAGNPLGTSMGAENLRKMLQGKGITSIELFKPGVEPEAVVTPVCDIYVTPDGERTMFGRGFAHLEQFASQEEMPWPDENSWFTAEPNMEKLSREIVIEASRRNLNIYTMDFIRPDDPVLPGAFWQSSTDWAGFRNNAQKNLQWVKQWVADRGCFAILSDGPNGFVAGSPDLPVRAYPPFPAPDVVDTTGAGDMFRAGMLHGLHLDWELSDCLRFASAAGCLKCRSLGATSHVPTVGEIRAHIAENPDVSTLYG
jgi:sugar/nucleoside kinase (ribokinase family)